MTMNELHALYEQYFPSAPPPAQQGRAGVTMLRAMGRYDNLEKMPALRSTAPTAQVYWWHKRVCPVCCKDFDRNGSRRKYCSDACQQKAYRQRKKAAK